MFAWEMCLVASDIVLLRGWFCRRQSHPKTDGNKSSEKIGWHHGKFAESFAASYGHVTCKRSGEWRRMHEPCVATSNYYEQKESRTLRFDLIFKANRLGHEPNFHWPVGGAGLAFKQLHKRFRSSAWSNPICVQVKFQKLHAIESAQSFHGRHA